MWSIDMALLSALDRERKRLGTDANWVEDFSDIKPIREES